MSDVFFAYLIFGLGFFNVMALVAPTKAFLDASTNGLIRGLLLCLVFWPIGLIMPVYVKVSEVL